MEQLATDEPIIKDFSPPPLRQSGQRLRPIELVAQGQRFAYGPWFDQELNETCTFADLRSKNEPCLPNWPFTALYGDDACSELPLFPVEAACGSSFGRFISSKAKERRVARLGTAPQTVEQVFVREVVEEDRRWTPRCHAVPALAGKEFLVGETEVPLTRFVRIVATAHEQGSTRIAAVVSKMEDGSRVQVGFYDTKLGTECLRQYAADGRRRCLPDTPWNGRDFRAFSDPECRFAIEGFPTHSVPGGVHYSTALMDRGSVAANRKQERQMYPAARHDGPIYEPVDGVCQARARREGYLYFTQFFTPEMRPVPPETFAPFALVGAQHGRLQRLWFSAGPDAFDKTAVMDTQFGERECVFRRTPDGVFRCLPDNPAYRNWYLDAECVHSTIYLSSDSIRMGATTGTAPIGSRCTDHYAVFQIRPRPPQIFRRTMDASCLPATTDGPAFGRGTQLSAESFVRAEEVLGPP